MQGIYTVLLLLFFMHIYPVQAQESASENLAIAIELNKKGEYKPSIFFCNKALKLNNKLSNAFFLRGFNYYKLEAYDEAIKDFNTAIQLKSDYQEAYFYRAKCKQSLNQYFGAIKDFNKARELNPAQATFFFFKGIFTSVFGREK